MPAEAVAKALGGVRFGSSWSAKCPSHRDRCLSLSISDGKDGSLLVYCHAGCGQVKVINALRDLGLWPGSGCKGFDLKQHWQESFNRQQENVLSQRMKFAQSLWAKSKDINGTLAEIYLRSRGLEPPARGSLRFSSALKHVSGEKWPAMIALVRDGKTGSPTAIHRTYLAHDGRSKALVDRQRLMLGPCRGGAVRLGEPDSTLMVGEGIETCLSAMQVARRPTWAALSTTGMCSLELPPQILEVIVLADGDEPGEEAAQSCARRWAMEGRKVRIARPPRGKDFNDLLLESFQ